MGDPLIGSRLGAFHVEARIGTGGLARVYRARQSYLERVVALKVLGADVLGSLTKVRRFLREATRQEQGKSSTICNKIKRIMPSLRK